MPHESVWACRYKLLSFLLIHVANLGTEAVYPTCTDPRYEDEGYACELANPHFVTVPSPKHRNTNQFLLSLNSQHLTLST